jgi:hypothetical protein
MYLLMYILTALAASIQQLLPEEELHRRYTLVKRLRKIHLTLYNTTIRHLKYPEIPLLFAESLVLACGE